MADYDQYYIDKAKICEENGQIPAELYTEYEFRRRVVRRVRLFGVLILKITSVERETDVRLFGVIPFLNIQRRFR